MTTMMEMALLQKIQEQEMMLSPASSAIPTAGCSQGAASFAQERIWLNEKIHYDPSVSPAMHNFVLPLVIKHGSMSIERIRSAISAVLEQYEILRTAIYFDENRNMLVQAVQSVVNNGAYSFEITANDIQSLDEVADLLRNESVKHFAELEQGLVVRCHLVKVGSDDDMDKLHPQDLLIFIFHGVTFDYNSIGPFLGAFTKAYDQVEMDVERLQYISFSLYEHQPFINIPEDSQIRRAQQFWSKMMDDYSLDTNYPTPFTRPFDTKKRSGEGHSTSFILDSMLVEVQVKFASLYGLSMFHTALACFFLFIYELNDGTISDLCVTCPTENRSFIDTKCMIGTFANLLPYRIKINANESFINLVQQICKLDMDILNHCQLPYQQIIKGNRELCSSKIPFHFQYEEIHSSSISEMKSIAKTNDATLSLYTEQPWLHGNGIASHDMNLKMVHNQFSQTTYCIFECSADCYDEVTVSNIGRYFQTLLLYTFTENTKTIGFDPVFEKIGNLSLLPMNVETLSNIIESLRHFSEIKPASYAQRQIWLDEERRLHLDEPQLATYNMVFCYRLSADHTMSVQQLRYALDLVVDKHQSLRTSFVFDTTKNILTQRIVDQQNHKNNRFSIVESIYETDEQLDEIIHNETHNPHVFDLTQGLVFRCHLVRYKQVSTNDLIADNDIIIFNFHHASFDRPSMKIFLHDLHQAYTTSQLLNDDNTNNRLRYLDYAVIEQHMPMIGASMFWHDALHNYKLYQSLSLPYDRYRPTNEYRSGFGTSISFDLDRDLCDTFLHYTSSQNISIEHLALSMYFVFLFKLTNEQTDLCIGMNVDGRYRDELKSVIGMFVNAIPLRCQLDPQCFLHELIKHVQEILTNSRKYSYFPLQRLLDQHSHASKPAFVDTSFQFIRYSPQDLGKDVIIGDSHLSVMPTTMKIGEGNIMSSQINKPIYELSLILSNEQYLMQSLNNTQTSFSSDPSTCIHHEFVYQVMKHPQKLAVELDEQSLTYAELLYYVQVLSLTLLNEYHVFPGEIVCQCVERSLSMVIGIMGIEMAGGVYCPLSPRDPQHRLYALTQQTQSRLVLVHDLTKTKFDHDIISLDIDSVLINNDVMSDVDVDRLSSVIVTPSDIAYIIFTSGSTGTPKAVQVRHKNFIDCMHSLVYINSFNKDDTVVQMTRCSFDIHVQEILGTLLVGGTLIMLQPGGTIDFDYLSEVLQKKQITYLHTVPSLLHSFFTSIEKSNSSNVLKHLRSLCSSGEPFSVPLIALIVKIGITNCITWNLYGPAEATIDCTVHRVDVINDTQSISIGRPLFNYRCIIMNQYLQSSAINQEGELFVGGVGVFVGYLGRDDLTVKALVEIDGQLFYRTGDLVRIDNNCLLHYQGRKDHQIKLHGQRIELGEIERCLLNITSISACVVLKWNDDYLVAYAQSSHMNEEQLRQHCQSHLPPHMIPSIFIILEKLPLNQNGKIDRKLLPSPHYSSSTMSSLSELDKPVNQMEKNVYDIWCQVLEHNRRHISTTTNFLTIGGHSRLFIELYHRYQSVFNFDAHTLSIVPFLQQPTIFQHSQLLQTVMMNNITTTQWYTLHINEGVASFTQERIFLDEQVRFSSDIAIYNEQLAFQVVQGSLSLNRLLQALRYVLNKHKILRTSLMFNNDNSSLKQCITDIHATFAITMNQTFANENELRDITYQTTINPNLFNLSTGRVFHAEIVRHQISLNENNSHDLITISDVLLIVFHHAAYDRSSFSIFFDDLCLAYNTNTISIEDDESLHYIDYSVQERLIDMTTSREFWYLQLEGYNLEYRLLPVDRHRLSDDHRSSCASVTQISFDNEISQSFLDYASMHHVTPFQLGLTILYAFLFKLTHGENDLCLSCLNANRHKTELQNIMGMFVSTLPYRVQLDPQWSFADLVKYVREKCLSILEHSHYPLQHILANLHINQSNISFLEAVYDFITISSRSNELSLDRASLKQASFEQSFEVAKFDFMLMFVYNPMLENNRLSFRLTCSHDLFDGITVRNIGRRLEYCFQQLFSSNETIDRVDTCFTSISKFDLILLQETQEMEDAVLCRQSYIINEAPASFAQIQLWHNERVDFTSHISQVPIYNMPFVYQLHPHHTLSVQHLCHALQLIVIKHEALRTSLTFHTENNRLIQQIAAFHQNDNTLFSFIESTYTTHEQLNHIIHDEKYNPQLFDLAQGLVIRCHLVYYKDISSNHRLSKKDIIIFNFHHAMFDFPSMNIFLHDLNEAYTTGQLLYDDNTNLRYLDYAVIEQQMSMSGASMFWLDILHDCKLDQSLSLPFDRYRLSDEYRTGRGTSISFDFGQDLSDEFLAHASSNNISLEHLIFAIYFIFLFKLTNGQTDLCIAMNINNNRYRHELKSIIGLFENVIPLRCELDPHWSFYQLLEHVQEITTDSMKYSYFPLQRILNQHPHISTHAFLDTSLEFISNMSNNSIMIGDSELVLGSFSFNMNEDEIFSVSDFSLSIYHDLDMNQLSCTINGSLDLFNSETVEKISQRFQSIVQQLSASISDNLINKPIYELSLILSDEQYLMQSLNNTQISFSSPHACIHHEFVCQAMKHPQKLAVELDEQSVTYCELLYYVQVLSLTLLNEYHLFPGEIVCQCVERSLSMVIGIMGIEMAGGVYCPLSPRDAQHRLRAFTQQTQSRLILVHYLTKMKFSHDIVLFDMDSILNVNIDKKCLSRVIMKSEEITYIIFTSGSTGTPKAVQLRQQSFINSTLAFVRIDALHENDVTIQIASVAFDAHILEIVGSLICGATIMMLHPHGETVSSAFIKILMQFVAQSCRIWNFYGPAEATLGTTCHLIDVTSPMHDLPIGKPLPSYICLLLNNFSQPVMIQEEGELLVGGLGVFFGYLGRDDLTAKALVEINDELFYRTGDVVRMDSNGLLYYQGRKDHQIKLHGQRIELGEIEQCLLRASISVCVVIRGSDDHLVAYVQSSNVDEKQLRQHCQSHLPPYMIPSFFIILDKLPLNANGKIDRKSLPTQKTLFHALDTIHCQHIEPSNELEIYIHSLWCQILCHSRISIDANFFGIGGHSLLLIQLYHNYKITLNIDTTRINISKLFQYTTIADHARLVRQSVDDLETYQKLLSAVHNTQETSIRKRACSISQENIILVIDELSRYEPFPVTNIQLAYLVGREGVFDLGHVSTFHYKEYSFTSTFDIECFERALNCLIQRHEALRLIFPSHTEQRILKTVPYYTISVLNLGDVESSRKLLIERREQLSHQVRPADQWPLFDFQITRFISDDEYKIRLHFGIDALIMDFWSTNLILHELNQLYYNLDDILVELKLSYRDYILAEQQWKQTAIYSNDRQYWINRLKSFPLGPNLPLQCLPNEIHVQRHSNAETLLDQTLWQKLRKRITDHRLTPAGFLASIYALVLSKWSENKHFALNLPVFNRLPIHPQVNQIVGDFTTVVPLEINFDKVITYYEFLHTVQKQLWNDVEHISYDGVSFIRDLMQMHQTREILLPYVFTCAIDVEDIREKNVEHNIFYDNKLVYVISQTPQVFIDHGVLETDGCLSINWVYVDNLLRKEMVIHMHDTFVDLLVKLASFDDLWQNPIFIPLPSEQQERRLDFNQTQWESNIKEKLLHSLVIKQAELTPNALAIVSSQVNLTYEQLLNRVYSLAYHLQQQHEMKSNQLIAILMTKGWEQIVACLAILVSGSAYLPLDIDSPYDRLFSLIEETNVTILLTQSHSKHAFPHITTISVDTFTTDDNYPMPFPIKQQSSTDLAYVIYTSGSTGKPKGVMISHQAVVNTILDMNSRLKITSNDRIFALSHLNFDLSVYDIFGILIDGGTIVIPDHEDYKNPEHWYDMMVEHRVTIWNSVPMLMQMFVEHLKHTNNHNNQLRHILLSGDWIPVSLPESIQTTLGEQVTITSLGGATEASIWSIAYTLPKEIPREWKSIPYGIPLRNQQYYVYDIHLDDCPEWVIGELYIGGEGLANGYWNDQEKTQSSFIIHSLTNERLYRTGDYGRFLPTGYIEFTGRKDFQVKVHGHRIELGEIEHHLQQHPDIQQAIVNLDDKSQHLVGYVMLEKNPTHNKEYDSTEMLIVDSIERINFKLARHSIKHPKKIEKSFALTKPKLTETLINTYYMRKSYRQFTNETIERSTIEKLLKNCHNSDNNEKISLHHLDFDILSQLLAVLTPISISDQPLPKYRYASIDDLYPVQVYIELPTSVDNILPGVYYHNPDEHTLELISTHINNDMMDIRLHLVGRSSAIAPLYGKRLGSQFCMLETGYVMGLLEKEGSRLGLIFSENTHNESITRDILNIDKNDTYCCFKNSSSEQNISNNVQNDNHQCIIYLKSINNNKDQWFIYNKKDDTITPFDVENESTQEEIPLFFDDDNDAKIIFHDCQWAIFFVGRSEYTINIGKMSHLLMDHCLEMNIGMCPISTRTSFPKKINGILDTILIHEKLNGSNILHTLLIGKISDKQKSERTISEVKSISNWSETLRIYLRKKLPIYMVPSHFINVSSFPLSLNGKIDRKALPEISLSVLQHEDTYNAPNTELEKTIANIWQEILYTDRLILQHDYPAINVSGIDRQTFFLISATASFFSVGGNSLLLVKIYQHYQSKFNFESEALSIRSFFEYNTIVEHAKLLETIIIDGAQLKQWHTLNINEVFNDEDSILKQSITDEHLAFTLAADQTFKNEDELQNIVHQMTINPKLFDLSIGRVFYCQILRQHMISDENNDKEMITSSDVLVIGFHHVAIDHSTFSIFFNDLWNTYNSHVTWLDDGKSLQYIDYAVHERLIDMTLSREFWRLQLEGCNLKRRLSLPIDQHCLSNDQQSGFASTVQITFDRKISSSFLNYASLHHLTLFQLGLATFYTFLFKLTYSQTDLCISCVNANRYRPELQSMIGMFISTLPYRMQLDPCWSFDEVTKHVREKCLSILEHSYYPLQHILRHFHRDQLTTPFLQTVFDFMTDFSFNNQFTFDDASLQPVPLKGFSGLTKFDFTLTFYYDPILGDDILSCDFICSRDLFEDTTVTKMIQRFQYLFEQLFSMNFNVNQADLVVSSIAKLTLILPDEMNEMQHVAFYRQSNVTNDVQVSLR
ncbi:unnamed protein product [Adineta steineri]|uniref:Carrier domain-containing protein n=1 Tax=Adineta steineri TaxID=433720 RepID=A0A819FUC1_9BILA|nr:unnamed protein product [Adineta steineri]